MIRIEVHQKEREGANGDRATKKTMYFSYEVVMYGPHGTVILQVYEGYDNFHTHILPDCRQEAEEYAQNVASVLERCEYVGCIPFRRRVLTTETWERAR